MVPTEWDNVRQQVIRVRHRLRGRPGCRVSAPGHIPVGLGGARVALVSVAIEATGLSMIWVARGQTLAAVGAILAGCDFALVCLALGTEAVRRVPLGLAMGAYTAFLGVAGIWQPGAGLIAGCAGLRTVFLAATLIMLCAAAMALRLLYTPQPARGGYCAIQ